MTEKSVLHELSFIKSKLCNLCTTSITSPIKSMSKSRPNVTCGWIYKPRSGSWNQRSMPGLEAGASAAFLTMTFLFDYSGLVLALVPCRKFWCSGRAFGVRPGAVCAQRAALSSKQHYRPDPLFLKHAAGSRKWPVLIVGVQKESWVNAFSSLQQFCFD